MKITQTRLASGCFFPHPGGYDVRSAGGAVCRITTAVHSAADHTGRHRPQNGGGAGVIGDGAQVHLAQHQRDGGEHQHEHQRFAGEVPVDFFPGQQDQRQVDEQGEVADVDVQQVLQHGGRPLMPAGGEGVGKDEQLIADAHQAGQTGCDRVAAQSGPRGMCFIMFRLPPFSKSGPQYTPFSSKMQQKLQKNSALQEKFPAMQIDEIRPCRREKLDVHAV